MNMKKILFILVCHLVCNGIFAQSLGKMTLGCSRADIQQTLPKSFRVCKANTPNKVTYATNEGDEYVSFYLDNNLVNKIEMHKFVEFGSDANRVKSKLEELMLNLYEMWGEPSYIGENIYWQFPASKATVSYTVSTSQAEMDPLRMSGSSAITTFYRCYADIVLERKANFFE